MRLNSAWTFRKFFVSIHSFQFHAFEIFNSDQSKIEYEMTTKRTLNARDDHWSILSTKSLHHQSNYQTAVRWKSWWLPVFATILHRLSCMVSVDLSCGMHANIAKFIWMRLQISIGKDLMQRKEWWILIAYLIKLPIEEYSSLQTCFMIWMREPTAHIYPETIANFARYSKGKLISIRWCRVAS